jgi:hypothetical protein
MYITAPTMEYTIPKKSGDEIKSLKAYNPNAKTKNIISDINALCNVNPEENMAPTSAPFLVLPLPTAYEKVIGQVCSSGVIPCTMPSK